MITFIYYNPNNHIKYVGLISKAILIVAKIISVSHSHFDNFRHVLMNMNVIINVIIRTHTEKILSLNIIVQKLTSHQLVKRQVGFKCNGVITDDIPIIHRILNISDHITFQTHISYFFFIIAAKVAATSGKDVHAATIVAQIAHSETQKFWAIKTAACTTKSEERTNIPKLASNFAVFKIIHKSFSFDFHLLLEW